MWETKKWYLYYFHNVFTIIFTTFKYFVFGYPHATYIRLQPIFGQPWKTLTNSGLSRMRRVAHADWFILVMLQWLAPTYSRKWIYNRYIYTFLNSYTPNHLFLLFPFFLHLQNHFFQWKLASFQIHRSLSAILIFSRAYYAPAFHSILFKEKLSVTQWHNTSCRFYQFLLKIGYSIIHCYVYLP